MASDAPSHTSNEDRGQPLITAALAVGHITKARHEVAAYLRRHQCPYIDAAVLVASELITNAVIHGDGADRIEVRCDQARVHLAVHDSNAAHPVVVDDEDRLGGRGMRIIDQLATTWGIAPAGVGKEVWAVVPCATSRVT